MPRNETVTGARVRGKGLAEYSVECERCGVRLELRNRRRTKLCVACINDPIWGKSREERGLTNGSEEHLH